MVKVMANETSKTFSAVYTRLNHKVGTVGITDDATGEWWSLRVDIMRRLYNSYQEYARFIAFREAELRGGRLASFVTEVTANEIPKTFSAIYTRLNRKVGIVEMTDDSTGDWCGSFRVDITSDLYDFHRSSSEYALRIASREAKLKDGRLSSFTREPDES